MKYVLAISGGVDSVVLLDMAVNGRLKLQGRTLQKKEIIVAHFDHGIREESAADARFVEGLAKKYDVVFETKREDLGKTSSESLARERRYKFLHEVAQKYEAAIVTAHHADDVVETIAINLQRGTGWRGLAVLDRRGIVRPMLEKTKAELYDYALKHSLEWVEDETNASGAYLRNRLRKKLHKVLTKTQKKALLAFRDQQIALKQQIAKETTTILSTMPSYSRYFFIHIDGKAAEELLRYVFHSRLTKPQIMKVLHAIKTAKHGTILEAGGSVTVKFSTDEFIVETSGGVVQ